MFRSTRLPTPVTLIAALLAMAACGDDATGPTATGNVA